MAVSPMFITEYRSRVVDFTRPFMSVEATMLLRKPPHGHESHIKSITDLLNQSEIKYGTLNTGLLLWSFKNTNESMCKIMWRNMQRFKPSVLTKTNDEGIWRVRREKYAFILPSTIGEYIAKQSPCDLMTVDRFLMERGYGIALPKGSPFLPQLNRAISRLKKNGFLNRLYHKWWVERNDCPNGVQSSKIYSVNTAGGISHGVLPIVVFLIFVQT